MTGATRLRRWRDDLILSVGLAVVFVLVLGPILWLLVNSFKTNVEALAIPPKLLFAPTIENYHAVVVSNPDFSRFYLNSVLTSLSATVIVLVFGIPAAYVLARARFRGRVLLAFLILSTRMVPQIALGIPTYLLAMRLNLLDTYTVLIVSYVAFNLPFSIWLLMGFVRSIPVELEEAAAIDGCTRFQAIVRVILPLMGPGLAAVGILVMIVCWREFFLPLILTSSVQAKPLSVVAGTFITEYGINWGQMSAFSMLTLIPVIIIAIYAQKYLISGLTMGAVKE